MAAPEIVRYLWDFGDGNESAEVEPEHTYRMPGTYTPILYMWDTEGYRYCITCDTISVYDWAVGDSSDSVSDRYLRELLEGVNVSITDKCFRYAVHPSQGIGWAEYTGDNWPFPEGRVGTCEILGNNNKKAQLVMDSTTFRIHRIGVEDVWTDAEDEYGGSEIESQILLREHEPPIGASAKLRHSQTHTHVKPWYKDRRNEGEYNSDGYRENFSEDVFIRSDSLPTDAAITQQVPDKGQLVFDRHIVSENLQCGITLRGAPWRFIRVQQFMLQVDTSAAPPGKLMTEMVWALEATEPNIWLRRSTNPLFNAATGEDAGGSFTGLISGPDGYSRSGVLMSAADRITVDDVENIGGDFTLQLWLRAPTDPVTLLTLVNGNLNVTLDNVGDWELQYNDDGNNVVFDFSSGLTSWTLLTLVRDGSDLIAYRNSELINTINLSGGIVTIGGNAVALSNGISWFDFRLLPRVLSSNAIEYFYNDITQNSGNATCPPF